MLLLQVIIYNTRKIITNAGNCSLSPSQLLCDCFNLPLLFAECVTFSLKARLTLLFCFTYVCTLFLSNQFRLFSVSQSHLKYQGEMV